MIFKNYGRETIREFSSVLCDNNFPCTFALAAFRAKGILSAFVGNNTELVSQIVTEYTHFIKQTPIAKRIKNPLVIFFKRNFQTLQEEYDFAWQQIQKLHDSDIAKWPQHIPTDTNHHNWTFCFNDVELFFNVSCPHHILYKNRNLGKYMTFVINPRENFDYVASMKSKSGQMIRQNIRKRVQKYNNGHIPKELGFFGDVHNIEWRQYTLAEGNSRYASCPLKLHNAINSHNAQDVNIMNIDNRKCDTKNTDIKNINNNARVKA